MEIKILKYIAVDIKLKIGHRMINESIDRQLTLKTKL